MKKRSFGNICKNALGTVFLLAGAFFVCSTLLSMRAVFADPIAPIQVAQQNTTAQSSPRANNRTNPRAKANSANVVTRQTNTVTTNNKRNVATRNISSRANVKTSPSRNVVARTTNRTTATRTGNRAVRARSTETNTSRVSLSGDAIRGAKGSGSTYYTYMSGKLYSGNYSNIIDSTTGLISADAYNNCLESYYTCMDEICTARNEAQRRCACAGRVTAFAAAEDALQSANEELIKVSGQLALLIANKGKEVSAAFTLTEAEQVMNCASWREASQNGKASDDVFGDWCANHGEFDSSTCSRITPPSYCKGTNNSNLFDVDNLDGAGSDILASLASWADQVKDSTDVLLGESTDTLASVISNLTGVVSGITGTTGSIAVDEIKDNLATTWGYDLYAYAHNNVCSRVLDSCFNGIYEACGNPPSNGRCANGATSSCPFNYNSIITVTENKDVEFVERKTATTTSSASCFGYTSASGDPYSSLRGPVADARRSIMQKYLLDANADCDLYGEQLKTAAQKITYQKVAAQQALQKKRLEFYTEEQERNLSEAIAAGTNFNECISELWDCYQTQETSNPNWSSARIKTYCAQIANAPHCYQDMICNPSVAQFKKIIDEPDGTCTWNASDGELNTCRNIVTLNEILTKAGNGETCDPTSTSGCLSDQIREKCLKDALGCEHNTNEGCIRGWERSNQ
ncbi:MAG: hypothetical protein K6B71_01350 [Alphaproteobacteria bacterium]|nr:hypothetical protein [Alphaproteobacteria bacterium]